MHSSFDGSPIPAFDPLFAFAELPTHYREYAGFGNVTFKIDERFDVTAGLRWAKNKQTFRQISGGAILPSRMCLAVRRKTCGLTRSVRVCISMTIRWPTFAWLAATGRWTERLLPDVPPQVNADKLTNYEAGIKSEFLDRRALVNLSYFFIDWKGIQQIQAFGGISALSNAGDASSKGFELESAFRPTEHLAGGLQSRVYACETDVEPAGHRQRAGCSAAPRAEVERLTHRGLQLHAAWRA